MSATRHYNQEEVALRRRRFQEAQGELRQAPYRALRKNAMRTELGEDHTLIDTIGDVLDAVVKALYGDFSELDEIAAKIAEIKQRYPKEAKP